MKNTAIWENLLVPAIYEAQKQLRLSDRDSQHFNKVEMRFIFPLKFLTRENDSK